MKNKSKDIKFKTAEKIIELENQYSIFLKRVNKFYKMTNKKSIPINTIKVLNKDLSKILFEINKEIIKIDNLIKERINDNFNNWQLELTKKRLKLLQNNFLKIKNKIKKIEKSYYIKDTKNKNKKFNSTKDVNNRFNLLKTIKLKLKEYKKLQHNLNIILDLDDNIEKQYEAEPNKLLIFLNKHIKLLKEYKNYVLELEKSLKKLNFKINHNFRFNNKKFILNEKENNSFYKELKEKDMKLHRFLDYLDLYEDLKEDYNIIFVLKNKLNLENSIILKEAKKLLDKKVINENNYLELLDNINLFYLKYNLKELLIKARKVIALIDLIESNKQGINYLLNNFINTYNLSNTEQDFIKKYSLEPINNFEQFLRDISNKMIMDILYNKYNNKDIINILENIKEVSILKIEKLKEIFYSFKNIIEFINIFDSLDNYIESKTLKINDYQFLPLVKEVQWYINDKYSENYDSAVNLIEDFRENDYIDIKYYDNIIDYSKAVINILKKVNDEIALLNNDITIINKKLNRIKNYTYSVYDSLSWLKNELFKELNFNFFNDLNLIKERLWELIESKYNKELDDYKEEQRLRKLKRNMYKYWSWYETYSWYKYDSYSWNNSTDYDLGNLFWTSKISDNILDNIWNFSFWSSSSTFSTGWTYWWSSSF